MSRRHDNDGYHKRQNVHNVQQHYNNYTHNHQHGNTTTRQEGPAYALKLFHNQVKRQLYNTFAFDCPLLLDLACGRGGDIQKYMDARIKRVIGLDVATREVLEARNRFETQQQKRGQRGRGRGRGRYDSFRGQGTNAQEFDYTFLVRDVGKKVDTQFDQNKSLSEALGKVDVVACQFALHFLFQEQSSMQQVFQTVKDYLKPGGYFIGTVPDGRKVQELLGLHQGHYKSQLVQLQQFYQKADQCGSGYKFAIRDTVTQAANQQEDWELDCPMEYLVSESVLIGIAKAYDLEPVDDYEAVEGYEGSDWPMLVMPIRTTSNKQRVFRQFNANYYDIIQSQRNLFVPDELKQASSLYACFVFQKKMGANLDGGAQHGCVPHTHTQPGSTEQQSVPIQQTNVQEHNGNQPGDLYDQNGRTQQGAVGGGSSAKRDREGERGEATEGGGAADQGDSGAKKLRGGDGNRGNDGNGVDGEAQGAVVDNEQAPNSALDPEQAQQQSDQQQYSDQQLAQGACAQAVLDGNQVDTDGGCDGQRVDTAAENEGG